MNPKISIIIPTYNRAESLRKTLSSIYKQEYNNFEVIVINDNSIDNTLEVIKSFGTKVRYFNTKKNSGAAIVRNIGLKNAKGRFIAFTDDDCTVDRNWLKDYTEKIKEYQTNNEIAGISGIVVYPDNASILTKSIYFLPQMDEFSIDAMRMKKDIFVNNQSCTNSMWKKNILAELKGFDAKLRRGQDTDLSYRTIKKGYKFVKFDKAKVTHHYRASFLKFLKQQYVSGKGGGLIFLKHKDYFGKNKYLILGFPVFILLALFYPILLILPLFVCRSWIKALKFTHSLRIAFVTLFLEYTKYYFNLSGIWATLIKRLLRINQ